MFKNFFGRWYEITRYDHYFERGQSDVYSEYSLKDNGDILVKNFGTIDGKLKTIEGTAKFKYPDAKNIGLLKVSFFKPFYGDYKIVYVDENYTNMLVTSSTYNYFWLLSRNKYLLYNKEQLVNLLIIASNLGFDTTKMIMQEFEK